MRYNFHVNLNDRDYLDYNIFWTIRSPYGKKQMLTFRIVIAVLLVCISLLSLSGGGFSTEALIGIIPYAVLLVLLELLLNPLFTWILKSNIKSLKSKGKMGYSPTSNMEFYSEAFVETTPENRCEQKYSAIERISVITDKVIYIHVNNVMSYILPFSSFESGEQWNDFLSFIKTKCANIDVY